MHNFKKRFGQNFLTNIKIPEKIAKEIISYNKDIVEIGPGEGALTKQILKLTKNKLISYEIDNDLRSKLEIIKLENNNFDFIYKDFLKEDLSIYDNNHILCGNIPYNITSPIIFRFLESNIEIFILMIQKEYAERLLAKVSTKEYNALTVLINYYGNVSKIIDVSKKNFYPVPKVDSTVVKIEKTNKNIDKKFIEFIKNIFKSKRKTLKNNIFEEYNISKNIIDDILTKLNISLNIRSEQLELEKIYNIYKELNI